MSEATPAPVGRRLALLGVVLILVALGGLIWQARETDGDPLERVSAPPAAPPSLVDMLPRAEESVGLVPQPVAMAASGVAAARDRVEVCGLGTLKLDAGGQLEEPERLEAPLRQARMRMLVALANSPDEVERATGLFLQSFGDPPATFASKEEAGAVVHEAAETGPPMAGGAAALAREALATSAAHSRSPQVYALALNACMRSMDEGACRLLSTAQWARLDPRNAAPWLQVASDAGERGDTAGVSEALFNIAHASVNDARSASVLPSAMARVPPDAPVYVRTALGGELLGRTFLSLPSYSAISRHCDKAAVADANRQQACLAVAEVLTTRGGQLIDFLIGISLGERAGWPAERVQALRDERDAIQVVAAQTLPQGLPGLLGCAAQQKLSRYLVDVGTYGELGAMRRALKQSPDSVAVLAQRHRAQRAEAAARIQAAPATASQPAP